MLYFMNFCIYLLDFLIFLSGLIMIKVVIDYEFVLVKILLYERFFYEK